MQELNFIKPNNDVLIDKINLTSSTEEIMTVTEINSFSKKLLERNVPVVWIKGEISGLKLYKHAYFDLKDDQSKISCVMFSNILQALPFKINNGNQIEVRGKVTIYSANGSYQINIERVRQCGLGELWEAYHQLVNKLKEKGWFDSKHKKTIALCPQAIGVITSKEGSVIKDVITTLKRRVPHIPVIIYPTAVQGESANMQIANAIRTANQRNEVTTLIICRGGGSMEDLWCFNQEVIAQEVFLSKIPIISAIGHETDYTIIDMVADLRASTPTAAAELVALSRDQWASLFSKNQANLEKRFFYCLQNKQQYLDILYAKLLKLNPITRCNYANQHLNKIKILLKQAVINCYHDHKEKLLALKEKLPKLNISSPQQQLSVLNYQLKQKIDHYINCQQQQLLLLSNKLHLLNPESILSRGYAIVKDTDSNIIKSKQQIRSHQTLIIKLADGSINATTS